MALDLSIVVITHNRAEYLDSMLNGLQETPFRDVPICILNNASPDHTLKVCRKWEKRFPRMRVVTHAVNIGGNANCLRAYEYCLSSYYGWVLCDDDRFDIAACQDLVEALQRKEADLLRVSNAGVEFSEQGRTIRLGPLLEEGRSAFFSLGFIPGTVFKTAPLRDNFHHAYGKTYTCYQQVFLLMSSFPPNALVYTTKQPIVIRGETLNFIHSTIYSYWALSLEALPTRKMRVRAADCFMNWRQPFAMTRSVCGDRLHGRSFLDGLDIWWTVFAYVPSLAQKLIALMNLPVILLPRAVLRFLYRLRHGRSFSGRSWAEIAAEKKQHE